MAPRYIRFLKYSSIGVSTFLFDLVLLFLFIELFQMGEVVAAGVAFLIAVSINYVCSRRFVFRGTLRGVGSGYINFLMIAGTGLLFVMGGMYVMTSLLGFNYLLARVSVAGITGLWNYLMNLYVNFKVAGTYDV